MQPMAGKAHSWGPPGINFMEGALVMHKSQEGKKKSVLVKFGKKIQYFHPQSMDCLFIPHEMTFMSHFFYSLIGQRQWYNEIQVCAKKGWE